MRILDEASGLYVDIVDGRNGNNAAEIDMCLLRTDIAIHTRNIIRCFMWAEIFRVGIAAARNAISVAIDMLMIFAESGETLFDLDEIRSGRGRSTTLGHLHLLASHGIVEVVREAGRGRKCRYRLRPPSEWPSASHMPRDLGK